jgi:hypothetical protein
MSIVGFNFTKINAERKSAVVGQVNITNNIGITDISAVKMGLGGDRAALKVSFNFVSEYAQFATLQLSGDVILLTNQKTQEDILDKWTKSRQFPPTIAEPVMNHILDRCNVQALLLSKDLNLPSPVPLPKVKVTLPASAPAKETKPEAKKDEKKKK